ncbi:MAG: diguanylate cyclase [Planctomycetes bacterium]|jgi:diguanylate cyclase (GGDEF)-like protein|nr:diguanylate cyclase [Planctomycetota bacterium]
MDVLVADDDGASRAMLDAVLRKWGYRPFTAKDGSEALAVLNRRDGPLLVLLDWTMPGMDGLEVTRRVRTTRTPEPPYILMLTARGSKDDIVLALDAGANDYITKPYDPAELRARLAVGRRMIELQAALVHEAMHDPLTGAFNRGAVLEALGRELARSRRESAPLCVGLLDIDHFKAVNDTHGHLAGDEVLRGVCRCALKRLRPYDHFGRYGGEEFLVVLIGCGAQDGLAVFERLRGDIAQYLLHTDLGDVRVTVSIGALVPNPGQSLDETLAQADAALYRAKGEGRNRVVLSGEAPDADPVRP